MRRAALALAACVFAGPALSDVPRVVTDIPPVHSLTARVMAGVGTPELVLPPGASPHGYAMRPSEAAALEAADLVVWVGPELTPWLDEAITALSDPARSLPLFDTPDTHRLAFREGATFEDHEHGDGHGHGHGHDHGHDHGHAHDDHGHDHDHDGYDPHAWLDPKNAATWLAAIADALAEADPDNAAAYRANAADGAAEIDALTAEIGQAIAPLQGRPFIVFHDAYHYFEARFGIEAAGALALGDAAQPGPARLREIRDTIEAQDIACVFSEPQFEPRLIATVTDGTDARGGTLDPLGATLAPGPDLYPALIRGLANDLAACLDPAS